MANFFRSTPVATRNLLLANCIVFILQYILGQRNIIDFDSLFGLHFFLASDFHIWQLVTYMFLHGGLTHLFFNMFALWMFGVVIERTLGMQRFVVYYFICGIGAGICQELWQLGDYFIQGLQHYDGVAYGGTQISMDAYLNMWLTVGASGACYGVLLAFGVLYPEQRIMLLIPPIPMKAKYFVFGYAAIELISAFSSNGNIAHFAHLGGMLFGWLLLRYWRKHPRAAEAAGSWKNKVQSWQDKLKSKPKTSNWQTRASRETDQEYNLRKKQEEERLDQILDKIKLSGYDSLTAEEKRFLFNNSRN